MEGPFYVILLYSISFYSILLICPLWTLVSYTSLIYWNPFYSASIAVNWCHLATVIKVLTDSLMEHCKVYSNCFPQGYAHTHTPTHTHTHSTPLHIVLTPLAGNDIQPSSAVAVLVSITVSVRQKERQREVKRGNCRKRTDMSLINSQLRCQLWYCIVMCVIHIHKIPFFFFYSFLQC